MKKKGYIFYYVKEEALFHLHILTQKLSTKVRSQITVKKITAEVIRQRSYALKDTSLKKKQIR